MNFDFLTFLNKTNGIFYLDRFSVSKKCPKKTFFHGKDFCDTPKMKMRPLCSQPLFKNGFFWFFSLLFIFGHFKMSKIDLWISDLKKSFWILYIFIFYDFIYFMIVIYFMMVYALYIHIDILLGGNTIQHRYTIYIIVTLYSILEYIIHQVSNKP